MEEKYRDYILRTYLHNDNCDLEIKFLLRSIFNLESEEIPMKKAQELDLEQVIMKVNDENEYEEILIQLQE